MEERTLEKIQKTAERLREELRMWEEKIEHYSSQLPFDLAYKELGEETLKAKGTKTQLATARERVQDITMALEVLGRMEQEKIANK